MTSYTNILKFTITAPSLSTPVNAIYKSNGSITVNLYPFPTTPVDVTKLPLILEDNKNINVISKFPTGSLFTKIEFDGLTINLYDKDNNEIPFDRIEYNKLTKIVAGASSESSVNTGMIVSGASSESSVNTGMIVSGASSESSVNTGMIVSGGIEINSENINEKSSVNIRMIVVIIIGVVLVGGGGIGAYMYFSSPKSDKSFNGGIFKLGE
jgi:hypothetical protein